MIRLGVESYGPTGHGWFQVSFVLILWLGLQWFHTLLPMCGEHSITQMSCHELPLKVVLWAASSQWRNVHELVVVQNYPFQMVLMSIVVVAIPIFGDVM